MASTPTFDFLKKYAEIEGVYEISTARSFAHDEADYDRQSVWIGYSAEELRRECSYVMDICRNHGSSPGAPILEIGCGTGRLSLGLALQPDAGPLLITDPSPAFCHIVRRKLQALESHSAHVEFGILRAEDVNLLPAGSVSVILLRSVLHHVADVDKFLGDCAGVLPAGGLLVCEEPYYEGYLMMGFLAQFIEDALASVGYTCTPDDLQRIDLLIRTMQFYARRDVDKSEAEDKHLFRPDELMVSARRVGLDLTHYPNWSLTKSPEDNTRAKAGYFQRFFRFYVRNCMDWPAELSDRVAEATAKYFRFFEPLESGGNTTPACFGTFVFTRQ